MEDIRRAPKATEDLLQILNGVTKENYDLVRRQILLRGIRFPKGHVGFLSHLFKKPINSSTLTGEEFNEYLKSFLFTSWEIPIYRVSLLWVILKLEISWEHGVLSSRRRNKIF